MKWRSYLVILGLAVALPTPSLAADRILSIGIFPGTGTAEMLRADFRPLAAPFADELAKALGRKAQLTMYRSLKSINRSMAKGRKDVYFAPPTVAVSAFNKGYSPIARVEDFLKVALLRRKGATVTTVALTEKQSVPDVLARFVIKQNGENVKYMNVKTQEDVILAMKRNYAQAGGLGGKKAKVLLESGDYEVWYPLPASPGFTLVASDKMSESEKSRLEEAISAIDPRAVAKMQKAFVSKLGQFVADKDAEFKTLQQAMAGSWLSRRQQGHAVILSWRVVCFRPAKPAIR